MTLKDSKEFLEKVFKINYDSETILDFKRKSEGTNNSEKKELIKNNILPIDLEKEGIKKEDLKHPPKQVFDLSFKSKKPLINII